MTDAFDIEAGFDELIKLYETTDYVDAEGVPIGDELPKDTSADPEGERDGSDPD